MRIFLSHSSRNKPLLREIRDNLPSHISTWIDENEIVFGDALSDTLESAIRRDSDFVILFLDELAINSAWVKREVQWALNVEHSLDRTFVLPVVLDHGAWERFEPAEFRKRKYLSCYDFSQRGIAALAQNLSDQLFALLSRDLEKARDRKQVEPEEEDILDEADRFLRTVAAEIRSVLISHGEDNPLTVDELMNHMRSLDQVARLHRDQFVSILGRLQRSALLTGIYFDGEELFTEHQPYVWKIESHKEAKKRIARTAARLIENGTVITLDGGSTTTVIAQHIARGFISRRLTNLTVITNSMPAATELLNASKELGLKDDHGSLRVLLAGGRVRPNTLAVVSLDDDQGSGIKRLIEASGPVSLALVGTSGIARDGFTTRSLEESMTKQALLAPGARHVIVSDPSKFGREQDHQFATLEDKTIITTKDGYESILEDYEPIIETSGSRIIYA